MLPSFGQPYPFPTDVSVDDLTTLPYLLTQAERVHRLLVHAGLGDGVSGVDEVARILVVGLRALHEHPDAPFVVARGIVLLPGLEVDGWDVAVTAASLEAHHLESESTELAARGRGA